MSSNLSVFLGFCTGLALVAIAVTLSEHYRKKKGEPSPRDDYDERQILDRGRAYQFGFNVFKVMAVIYFAVTIATGREWFEGSSIIFLLLCVSAAAIVLNSAVSGSYVGIHTKVKKVLIYMILLDIADLFFAIFIIHDKGGIMTNGQVSFIKSTNLFALIPLTAETISYIMYLRANASETEE
ncbi:MAG: hypothetical protein ACI4LM_00080 [Anaerovoracaceae bacterium]